MRRAFLSLAFVCLLMPAFAADQPMAQSVRIADFVATHIELDEATGELVSQTISAPGASFIKVHFDYFSLPVGAYLEVRDPAGNEVYTYGQYDRDDFTYDPALDEDGNTRFAAMSITGDTAILTLIAENTFGWQDGHGVYISRYMEGYPNGVIEELTGESLWNEPADAVGPTDESTCGNMQRTPVECYASSYPTEYERAKATARLVMSGSLCTSWRVGDGAYADHMMTNNHCMSTGSAVSGSESWFGYQYTSCSSSTTTTPTKVSGNQMLKTDYDLDYTLYTVNNASSVGSFGNLGLDVRTPVLHEQIYIPQHGSGNPKELSIEDDQNSTGLCRIDDAIATGRATDSDTGYMCDTIGGSSGSPVLAHSSHKVIALHHFGGCNNQGVRIDLIWPQISTYFGGVIPNGSGGGNPGNNPPSSSFTYTTNVLSASFSDTSTDSDGTVDAWSWNFGDGSTSSSQNPSHTYAASGSYTVTLTVTDDDGATNSSSQTVTVSDGTNPNELSCGETRTGLSGATGEFQHFYIDVDASSVSQLNFAMSGGSGDGDLYVRFGAEPTTSSYDCRPYSSGNSENCSITSVQTGRYYVSVRGYSAYSGVSLSVTCIIDDGCTPFSDSLTGLSGSSGFDFYTQEVPDCATNLEITISGGTGDADLYVQYGSQPTTSSYDCRPYRWGNEETCTFTNPAAGTWHMGIRAYSAYSGVTLTVEYN